jgi:nitrate/nitrite-specific signal transduction histidine kinase
VTASTPVYEDNTFRGVIGVDISLVQLIERLNNLSPTTSGYAFLVDSGERLVAASPNALNTLLKPGQSVTLTETLGIPLNQVANPQILAALEQIRQEESGLVELELNDQPVLLAHAPLTAVGWQLGLVVPVAEIASRSQDVTATIRQDATDTLQSITLVLTAFFLVVLLLVGYVNRRLIVQRVETLAGGVQTIASGDLNVRIAPLGEDEIGLLGQSINDMAGQLAAARDELEARVAQRTRELAALYDVTAVASASLNLDEVLEQSLDRVLAVMDCTIATIHLLEEESQQLKMVTWRNVPAGLRARAGQLAVGEGIVGQIVAEKEPLVLSDMAKDLRALPDAAGHVTGRHAYIGVPMRAKGEVVGVLSVVGAEARQFTAEETALMVSIGDQIGVAVENARLYRQAEELAVVQERQRLARELHDAVTQSVYSATLLAATGQRAVAAQDWDAVANFLTRLQTITGQALKELRLLVYELRPSALQNAGLAEALQHRLDAVEARAGIRAQLLADDDLPLNEAQETTLYRVAVEALNNALKHAEATAVTVRIKQQNGAVTLTIEDDGCGFAETAVPHHGGVGLHSMQERARQLGGELVIESKVSEGTAVTLRLPKDANYE